MATPATALAKLLDSRSIIVCCGSGGVGKTTLSATLALHAAELGKKALVCTIDPARRLANSLGLDQLSGAETRVSDDILKEAGIELGEGSLWAMMLDTKRTFDRLIEKYASNEEARDRILNNRFYHRISSQVAGSQEYMAMEKLYEIYTEGDYDIVILDTPPTKNALDFLEAPSRMTDFLKGGILSWIMKPSMEVGRFGANLFRRGTSWTMNFVDKLIGLEFVTEVRDFFGAFEGMYGGFKDRSGKVHELLRNAETTAFILVTSPQSTMVEDALFFFNRLQESDMPIAGVIANRVHPDPLSWGEANPRLKSPDEIHKAMEGIFDNQVDLAGCGVSMADALNGLHDLSKRDHESLSRLYNVVGTTCPIHEVPTLEWDVHDIEGLHRVGQLLFAPGDARTTVNLIMER